MRTGAVVSYETHVKLLLTGGTNYWQLEGKEVFLCHTRKHKQICVEKHYCFFSLSNTSCSPLRVGQWAYLCVDENKAAGEWRLNPGVGEQRDHWFESHNRQSGRGKLEKKWALSHLLLEVFREREVWAPLLRIQLKLHLPQTVFKYNSTLSLSCKDDFLKHWWIRLDNFHLILPLYRK